MMKQFKTFRRQTMLSKGEIDSLDGRQDHDFVINSGENLPEHWSPSDSNPGSSHTGTGKFSYMEKREFARRRKQGNL